MKTVKVKVVCLECGTKFATTKVIPYCPKCGGSDIEPR
jgi:Zn finger protein HypA/HybF involved in hydrogenase expression